MSERTFLSIVIPVFNEAENLDELIERCILAGNRTGRAFEIILVDDGSSDGSAEKIDAASKNNLNKSRQ